MNLLSVAEYLELAGIGRRGRDLFVGFMPARIDKGILLLEPITGTPINHELPGYRRAKFRVVIRDADHHSGKDTAERVSMSLELNNVSLSGMYVKYMHPLHDPVVFPVSEADHLEYSVNFETVYVITNER